MSKLRRHVPVAIALILASLSSSCVFSTTRTILRHKKPVTSAQQSLSASRDDLNDRIARLYNAIDSFSATVDMTPSIGSVYKGQISEIRDVRAFVLFRKPAQIRIVGQYPVVRTTAFDMVSDGTRFRFSLPGKSLFFEGANDAPATSKNKIENLRPDAFLASMLVRPWDPATETPLLADQTDEEVTLYTLFFVKKNAKGEMYFSRSIWFDRLDLTIVRQILYTDDGKGDIVSDTRYAKWQPYGGVLFPAHIDINRNLDGYGVVMDVVKVTMNEGMKDEQFVLTQPEGSQLRAIGASTPNGPVQENH